MRASRMELLLPTIYYRFLNPVNPTARSMTYANIDTLSKKRYYIRSDVHSEGVCLSDGIPWECPLFEMLLISYCKKY